MNITKILIVSFMIFLTLVLMAVLFFTAADRIATQRYLVQSIAKYHLRIILFIFFIGFSSFLGTKSNLVYGYISKFKSILNFLIVYELLEFLVILICCVSFSFIYSSNSINLELKNDFKKLPIFNKFFYILFTFCYGIPNKILVNNELSAIRVAFFIFLIIISSNVFPGMVLLYVIFWITVLESFLFAVLYQDNVSFKNFMDKNLFHSNSNFSKRYFSFFWGNMNSGGAGKGRAGIVGTLLGGLYNAGRKQEQTHVREQAKRETQEHINNSAEKPRTPEESFELQKKVEDHIVDRDTLILKGEKQVTNVTQALSDWWTSS